MSTTTHASETDVEYHDACIARINRGHHDVPAYNYLWSALEADKAARMTVLEAETVAHNATLTRTASGEVADHLLAPFDAVDLHLPEQAPDLLTRDEIRLPALLDAFHVRHTLGEHRDGGHPFCPDCRPAEAWAQRSLAAWLARNPGRDVPKGEPRAAAEATAPGFLTLDDLAALPAPTWLVQDVIPDSAVGYLSGFDGTFKTFKALDWSLGLARQGRPVLYLMGEGASSTLRRVDAWCEHNGADRSEVSAHFDVLPHTVDLFAGGADVDALVERCAERRYALVVIDTLARSVGAGNQDSASDMSVVTQRLDRIKRATEGTVLVVAHTGKDADRGIRGSSALRANADFAVTMKREGERVRVSTRPEHGGKQKDAAAEFEATYVALPVADSMVLATEAEAPEVPVVASSSSPANRVLTALRELGALGFVSQAQIRGVVDTDASGKGPMNNGTVSRTVATLVQDGVVEADGTRKAYRLNTANPRARQIIEAVQ
ncbi:AAA family ATPase [Nocardioides zeae]